MITVSITVGELEFEPGYTVQVGNDLNAVLEGLALEVNALEESGITASVADGKLVLD